MCRVASSPPSDKSEDTSRKHHAKQEVRIWVHTASRCTCSLVLIFLFGVLRSVSLQQIQSCKSTCLCLSGRVTSYASFRSRWLVVLVVLCCFCCGELCNMCLDGRSSTSPSDSHDRWSPSSSTERGTLLEILPLDHLGLIEDVTLRPHWVHGAGTQVRIRFTDQFPPSAIDSSLSHEHPQRLHQTMVHVRCSRPTASLVVEASLFAFIHNAS